MDQWHATSFGGTSGISKYATIFFDEILSSRGYERLELNRIGLQGALNCIRQEDVVHIEIGVNQEIEIDLVNALCVRNHQKIDVTLHDPPFLKWPLFKFENTGINKISKAIHYYLRNFGLGEDIYKRLRRIYTLSNRGSNAVKSRYRIANVYTMPLIVSELQLISHNNTFAHSMLFFGFIGAGKSLGYALEIHRKVLEEFPECKFFVIGDALGEKSKKYLEYIKNRYSNNVEYLGFIPEDSLHQYFDRASIAILPFENYHSIIPVSYSTIYAMAKGKVVFTNPVNALRELIVDDHNGVFLTGNVKVDSQRMTSLLKDSAKLLAISANAISYLRTFHNARVVGECFDQPELTLLED